ncbi:GAF domain-containing protein [Lentzea sp. NPDC051838]|uniref:GAF domain-containing protein n=1 Tax=Lentzea sp. NPDC051838 TaxID=3154849 RepID=UPI00344746D1
MPTGQSQNLDGVLDDTLEAYQTLAEPPRPLDGAPPLNLVLTRVLDSALSLMGADFGNVQLLDPGTGALRIVTHSGFRSRFIDHFAEVRDDNSACGRAAAEHAQVVIADVATDPAFAPHRDIAAASGFRSVQSTPLVTPSGRLVGMISTHFRHVHRPPEHDLRMMDDQARSAGQAIARRLGVLDPDPADPLVDTMLSGLLGRLFSVGLSLASARSIVRGGPADERLVVATEEVDDLIRDVQTLMAERIAGQESGLRAVDSVVLQRVRSLSAIGLLRDVTPKAG